MNVKKQKQKQQKTNNATQTHTQKSFMYKFTSEQLVTLS